MVKKIIDLTEKIFFDWKDPSGYAPKGAAQKIISSKTDWIISLTHTFEMWYDKANDIDDMPMGEIILAYAAMGALVECWMMFVLSVHDSDYSQNKYKRRGSNENLSVKNMTLNDLHNYFTDTVWLLFEDSSYYDGEYMQDLKKERKEILDWIKKIEQYRNAIHCFKERLIGTQMELIEDLGKYYKFLSMMIGMLPESPEEYRSYL